MYGLCRQNLIDRLPLSHQGVVLYNKPTHQPKQHINTFLFIWLWHNMSIEIVVRDMMVFVTWSLYWTNRVGTLESMKWLICSYRKMWSFFPRVLFVLAFVGFGSNAEICECGHCFTIISLRMKLWISVNNISDLLDSCGAWPVGRGCVCVN